MRARIAKNEHNPAWKALEARWQAVVGQARGTLQAQLKGLPGSRYERIAAREVAKLGDDVEARTVIETTLAVVMMLELEPHRFKSDRAFRTQLVYRVRALTDINYGEKWNQRSSRPKRFYREIPPKSVGIIAEWVVHALGGAGLHVARLERRDLEQTESERRSLREALAELR